MGHPIYAPSSDEEKLQDDAIHGKIVCSTFHQAKGLERKVVIAFGIDASYFKFFAKDKSPSTCPNTIYVALTRALDTLIVFVHHEHFLMPCMKIEHAKTIFSPCVFPEPYTPKLGSCSYQHTTFSVTDLLKFVPNKTLDECYRLLVVDVIKQRGTVLRCEPLSIEREEVSDINGIAVTARFEMINVPVPSIVQSCHQMIRMAKENKKDPRHSMVKDHLFHVMSSRCLSNSVDSLERLL